MTRGELSPLGLTLGAVATPLGDMVLATDGAGSLHAAEFADGEERLRASLRRRLRRGSCAFARGAVPDGIGRAFAAYFAGDIGALDSLPLTLSGTAFQERVWVALRAIPPGAPMTYGDLAAGLGVPRSARAVGHANGANPFCIVVPCHRLVGASGALTGYSGGLERKRWLLDHEARFARAARLA